MIRLTIFNLILSSTIFGQSTPGLRDHFSMIYNSDRNCIILYGGSYTNGDGKYEFTSDTWEFSSKNWIKLDTGVAIGQKSSHVMAYDRDKQNIVLFGGIKPGELLSDTWIWNATGWNKYEGISPSARHSSTMFYYPKAKHIVLFSGHKREGTFDSDTWVWDGKEWKLKTTIGPQGRSRAGYCVDIHRHKAILFGGYIRGKGNANDMWEWNGEKWDSIPQPELRPSPRSNMYMAYDAKRKKVVLYGGSINENGKFQILDEVWEWDGKAWKKMNYINGPGKNEMYGMIYHEKLKKTIVYGGRSGDPIKTKNEMWTWNGKKWKIVK